MKALKINTSVNLTTGETVNSGSIVVVKGVIITNGYASATTMPMTVITDLYKGQAAYNNGKKPITEVDDFNTTFQVNLLITDYETVKMEKAIIDAVKAKLELIYPTFITEINL